MNIPTDVVNEINDMISRHCGALPYVVSLDEQTHIFHFAADGNWEETNFTFVNRNGNFFRIAYDTEEGLWRAYKHWNAATSFSDHERMKAMTAGNPIDCIGRASVGDKDGRERLCYLPKPIVSLTSKRLAVFRNQLIEPKVNMNAGTFTITANLKPDHVMRSPSMTGKLWESAEAIQWLKAQFEPEDLVSWRSGLRQNGLKVAKVEAKVLEFAGMDESPVWGMF